jgi:hypothetical protein
MITLDKIKMDGEAIIDKIKAGQALTTEDQSILKIYNSLYAKKAGNAGKRKQQKTGSGK